MMRGHLRAASVDEPGEADAALIDREARVGFIGIHFKTRAEHL